MIGLIVALCSKTFGIGLHNSIPWRIKEDVARFRRITEGGTVVMGRHTWESIPRTQRPLKNRVNVVVSSKMPWISDDDMGPDMVVPRDELDDVIAAATARSSKVFIIGGHSLYEDYTGVVDVIYATIVEKDVECDVFFPTNKFGMYVIAEFSDRLYSVQEACWYRFIKYVKRPPGEGRHRELQYLDLMQDVLEAGSPRMDRTAVGTRALFGKSMTFDVSKYVPFLTTKRLAWRSVITELLWFMSGSSDSNILERQGVNIWRGNTTRAFLDARGLDDYTVGDCGPMYSHSLRHHSARYVGCCTDYTGMGVDQLKNVITSLRSDPYSRRHLITTYDPSAEGECVLMVCHGIAIQFFVEASTSTAAPSLSCCVYSRSQDIFLGTPFNIASYSVLLHIVAKMTDMCPKTLTMFSGDTHLYDNHVSQAAFQLLRPPLPLPILILSDSIRDKQIDEVRLDDFTLIGYLHHPSIAAPMAV